MFLLFARLAYEFFDIIYVFPKVNPSVGKCYRKTKKKINTKHQIDHFLKIFLANLVHFTISLEKEKIENWLNKHVYLLYKS